MSTEQSRAPKPRRQWGSDRRQQPLPTVPAPVSDRRITIGRMAIVLTVTAWFAYLFVTIVEQFVEGNASSARLAIEAIVYILVVTALTASAIAYLITRIGFFYRSRSHERTPRAAIDRFYAGSVPSVTVLVPSYQEDERVIRTTLLSAALQEHPDLRVVLLVDDPPDPKNRSARQMLEAARALPSQIQTELEVPLQRVHQSTTRFEDRRHQGHEPSTDDMLELAACYEFAVAWLRGLGDRHEIVDHADRFFVDHVLGALASDLEAIATALLSGAEEGATITSERMGELHRRLVATFSVEMSSFERKQFVSSSHAPNKAMNLNSYISLMGGDYKEATTPLGRALVACSPEEAQLSVPDPDYILTLDADSVLLPEYCARIVYLMEQSGYARVGVAQTPYSAYPGSTTRIERIAGATTDIQHIVHQGMTQYDATFWVGANAILRKKALDDIVEIDYEDNWEIRRYIQDHTVIEDTESTIDLGIHGWTLVNYPERLAYSATPPDFGSLCIQRERWANGGLLILSKLRKQARARRARGERNRFGEVFLRVNYMASIFWASVCLLILLIYPFNAGLLKPLLPLIALPYFLMMASDLRYCGYKRLDVLRIYGFNLILLAVNLSGTFASALQLLTGEKSSFKRTPKVRNRTTARATFILAPWLLILYSLYWVVIDIQLSQWNHLFFASLNAFLALYAMVAFVGIRNSLVDIWVQLKGWLFQPARTTGQGKLRKQPPAPNQPGSWESVEDWASVLHYGSQDPTARPNPAAATAVPSSISLRSSDPTSHEGVTRADDFLPVFAPIVDLDSGHTVGYEALFRSAENPIPLGLDVVSTNDELATALGQVAVDTARELPVNSWVSLGIPTSLLEQPGALLTLAKESSRPMVIEIGAADLGPLDSSADLSLTIRGVEPGYESLALIDRYRPSYVKLRREAIRGIENDNARLALIRTLAEFASEHGCHLIADGIETASQMNALHDAGIHLGQGSLIGRPSPAERIAVPEPG